MEYPKISVIVPVYNVEQYLPRCIDSILSQTFTDFELLLIDDGSLDDSGKICDKYEKEDNRVTVFHTQNKGASAARNIGLNNAKGYFISFIDSDDWIEKNCYQDFFSDGDFIYDIYFQNYVCHNYNGTVTTKNLKSYSIRDGNVDDIIFYLLQEKMFGWTWLKLFKSSIIRKENIRFDENISFREDHLFTLQYCKYIKSIYVHPKANYHYYIYKNSLSHRPYDSIEFIKISNLILKECSYIKAEGISEYKESFYLSTLFMAVRGLYLNGNTYEIKKRLNIIKLFLSYYFSHKNIRSFYNRTKGRYFYMLLWHTRSPRIIDFILKKLGCLTRVLK